MTSGEMDNPQIKELIDAETGKRFLLFVGSNNECFRMDFEDSLVLTLSSGNILKVDYIKAR